MLKRVTFAISCVVLICLGSWQYRNSIALYMINHYLKQYDAHVTCLAFSLDKQANIHIESMCMDSPIVAGVINNIDIIWSFEDRLAPRIHSISILSAALEQLTLAPMPNAQPMSIEDQVNSAFIQLTSIKVPFSVEIAKLQMLLPVINEPVLLRAKLSSTKKSFYIKNTEPAQNLALTLEIGEDEICAEGKINLHSIHSRLKAVPPYAEWLNTITKLEGELAYKIVWDKHRLNAHVTTNGLDLALSKKNPDYPISVYGELIADFILEKNLLSINMRDQPKFNVQFSTHHFNELLETYQLSAASSQFVLENVSPLFEIQPKGQLTFNLNTFETTADAFSITNQNLQFELESLRYHLNEEQVVLSLLSKGELSLASLSPQFVSTMHYNGHVQLVHAKERTNVIIAPIELSTPLLNDELTALKVQKPTLTLSGYVNLTPNQAPEFELKLTAKSESVAKNTDFIVPEVTTDFTILGSEGNVTISGEVLSDALPLGRLNVHGPISATHVTFSGEKINVAKLLKQIKAHALSPLKPTSGTLSYNFELNNLNLFEPKLNTANASVTFHKLSGKWQDTAFSTLSFHDQFSFEDAHWQSQSTDGVLTVASMLSDNTLTSLRTNVKLRQVQESFTVQLQNLSVEVMGGQLSVPALQLPLGEVQSIVVSVDSLSLKELVSAQQSQGIVVEGTISGKLPVEIGQNTKGDVSILISKGLLKNDGDGVIKVKDNPAVSRMKSQQSNLRIAFEALENLQYHLLSAKVNMDETGEMILDTKIQGYNPDIDNDVNFNLNLNYDLPGLLQSLLIAEQLEKKLTDRLIPKESK
ncbi:YdbH domain-containing protein [Pseudoalteromonas xiamenensis]|uniref:YdbH domain-containing protein n=1 Tax=Pseudoalteromonas xiamenensis TaxID=882626 RepID=UPI0027E48821|nr:YdbH domain-containing protein [Pseudoalteromonas xiamenensis]WMN59690.1 YdbH domain-containing protein [Pseudoalteromonas xiamenensis]